MTRRVQQKPSHYWQGEAGLEDGARWASDFYGRTRRVPTGKDMRREGYCVLESYISRGLFRAEGVFVIADLLRRGGVADRTGMEHWSSAKGLDEGIKKVREFTTENGRAPSKKEAIWRLKLGRLIDYIESGAFEREGLQSYAGLLVRANVSLFRVRGAEGRSFWKTDEGYNEGIRRIREFENKTGRAPSPSEVPTGSIIGEQDSLLFGLRRFFYLLETGGYRSMGAHDYNRLLANLGMSAV